jgi:hypothetical protein
VQLGKAKRSAFSTIIKEALGTSTPTSTTVVETRISVSPGRRRPWPVLLLGLHLAVDAAHGEIGEGLLQRLGVLGGGFDALVQSFALLHHGADHEHLPPFAHLGAE